MSNKSLKGLIVYLMVKSAKMCHSPLNNQLLDCSGQITMIANSISFISLKT